MTAVFRDARVAFLRWSAPGVSIRTVGLHVLFLLTVSASSSGGQGAPDRDSLELAASRAYFDAKYAVAIEILASVPSESLSSRGLVTLGSSYAAVNDADRAIANLRVAVSRSPSNAPYRYQLGRMLASAGMTRDAQIEHAAAVAADSGFLPPRFSLGLLAIDRRNYGEAARWFLGVIERNPRDYLALYHLGVCYSMTENPDSARTFLAASLALNPRYGPAMSQLASLHYLRGEHGQALRLYRAAAREYSDIAEYRYQQGLCLERLEDWRGARDAYREAVGLDSTNSLYCAHLGQAYFELKRFDSSAVAYESAVRLDEENPVLLLNLGLAYARMGDVDRAEASFKRAIEAYEPAQVARVYNQLGALYFTRDRFRDAKRAYQSGLLYEPGNLEAQFFLAVSMDRLKEYRGAKQAYKKFLERAEGKKEMEERVKLARERIEVLP